MKTKISLIALATVLGFSQFAGAASLYQVYLQAEQNDPTYQQAKSTWMSQKQALPLAISGYLPSLTLSGSWTKNHARAGHGSSVAWTPTGPASGQWINTPAGVNNSDYDNHSYSISASQPIFSFTAIKTISQARASVKSATFTYLSSHQDLINRTLSAYFTVLKDYDALYNTRANKNYYYQLKLKAQQQYNVGIIAITGYYEAQSSYDGTVATEIGQIAKLKNDLESLRAITGTRYRSLSGISTQVPLITPAPRSINAWVSIATKQNYALEAQKYLTLAAKQNIGIQASSWLPTIGATASYGGSPTTPGQPQESTNFSYGLNVSYNPLQGGAIFANTKKARYDYLTQSALLKNSMLSATTSARKAYLAITSGISKVRADKQEIRSAQKSLEAIEAGYKVGTRTMDDILQAVVKLSAAKQAYSDDQYNYLLNIILLKQAAGTLTDKDVIQISRWLNKRIALLSNKPVRLQVGPGLTKPKKIIKPKKKRALKKKPKIASLTTSGYTLQFFASHSLNKARIFLNSLNPSTDLSIQYKRPWYKVIYGQYQNYEQAQSALAHIKKAYMKFHPWIYKLSN